MKSPPLLPPDDKVVVVVGRFGLNELGGGGRGRDTNPPALLEVNPPPKLKLPVSSIELLSGKVTVTVGVGRGVMGRKPPVVITGREVAGRGGGGGLTGAGLDVAGRLTGAAAPPPAEQRPG